MPGTGQPVKHFGLRRQEQRTVTPEVAYTIARNARCDAETKRVVRYAQGSVRLKVRFRSREAFLPQMTLPTWLLIILGRI